MTLKFSDCLAFTFRPEFDGQPYHVDRRGGGTAWAVTDPIWLDWAQRNGRFEKNGALILLANASKGDLVQVLHTEFWTPAGAGLPSPVNLLVWDFGVTSGPRRSVQFLQSILNVEQDGLAGTETIGAAEAADQEQLCKSLHGRQAAYYRAIEGSEKEGGWFVRNDARLAAALAALAAPSTRLATA